MAGVVLSPIFQLAALAALAVLVRRFLMRPGGPAVASGAIVMALGIVSAFALKEIPEPLAQPATRLVTLEAAIVWAYLAASYLGLWVKGGLSISSQSPASQFAVGTWVAGTSVLGVVIVSNLPDWRVIVWGLALLALLVWLWFVSLAIPGFRAIALDPVAERPTGRILLSTVATQSLVNVGAGLGVWAIPGPAVSLILLGLGFYATGAALILVRYVREPGWRLASDWDNTNCILHGAMSITGLATVTTSALPEWAEIAVWLWAAGMFVLVEAVEIARGFVRVRDLGWRQGVLSYDVSQWARVFTFGMFFAFTWRLTAADPSVGAMVWLPDVWSAITGHAQYVVVGVLAAEVAVFAGHALRLPRRAKVRRTPVGTASGRGLV